MGEGGPTGIEETETISRPDMFLGRHFPIQKSLFQYGGGMNVSAQNQGQQGPFFWQKNFWAGKKCSLSLSLS